MKKVAIPEKMQKFYGEGIMLHPDRAMVERLIKEIPVGKVAIVDSLCEKLAKDYDTKVTCPMRTSNLVKQVIAAFANEESDVPFWRVIRKNQLLFNSPFIELCKEKLLQEGTECIEESKGAFKVQDVGSRLYCF